MTQISPEPNFWRLRPIWIAGVTGLWLLALLPGLCSLLRYETTAGRQGAAPSAWQGSSLPAEDPRLPTLLVALHPRCSCSAATLAELESASPAFRARYNAILLIEQPEDKRFDWRQVASYREAQKALHAQVVVDEDGRLASGLGAFTSGEVMLYSAEDSAARRTLLFAGGVTGGRGMTGENNGIELLKAAFGTSAPASHAASPVFGCALFNAAPTMRAAGGSGNGSDQTSR